MTLRALDRLQRAEVVVHDRQIAPEVLALIPGAAQRVYVGKALGNHAVPQDGIHDLQSRPKDVHVLITGRRCSPEIIALADTVTEMTKVKHAFNAGIPAQRGIED